MPITGQCYGSLAGVVPTFDAATIAWVNAVVAQGGSVSAAREQLVDNFITGMKFDGVWSKLDLLLFHWMDNQTEALVDLVSDRVATAHGSPTFTANSGFSGQDVGSPTTWIDTGYSPASNAVNYAQNAAHISMWSTTNIASVTVTGANCGTANSTETSLHVTTNGGAVLAGINDNASPPPTQANPTTRLGHWLINRSGVSASQLYQNASLFSSPNVTSAAVSSRTFFTTCYNLGGNPGQGNPNTVGMFSAGGALTTTDITNFYNRLRAFASAVGVP